MVVTRERLPTLSVHMTRFLVSVRRVETFRGKGPFLPWARGGGGPWGGAGRTGPRGAGLVGAADRGRAGEPTRRIPRPARST